jgi:hypothetical protein
MLIRIRETEYLKIVKMRQITAGQRHNGSSSLFGSKHTFQASSLNWRKYS